MLKENTQKISKDLYFGYIFAPVWFIQSSNLMLICVALRVHQNVHEVEQVDQIVHSLSVQFPHLWSFIFSSLIRSCLLMIRIDKWSSLWFVMYIRSRIDYKDKNPQYIKNRQWLHSAPSRCAMKNAGDTSLLLYTALSSIESSIVYCKHQARWKCREKAFFTTSYLMFFMNDHSCQILSANTYVIDCSNLMRRLFM